MRSLGFALSAMLVITTACGGDDTSSTPDATVSPDAPETPDASVADASPPDAPPVPDAAPPPDARIADLSCIGAPSPTTAPGTINLNGTVSDVLFMSAI